ncbi:MAG TPA: SDR family oxidoreductase [Acidobacteriaceae bacterium]|nr:SDR family oxidoreductase [Acidobacteriaceae bacterium]
MSVPLSLAGRTALVTGGSRGIGAATVRLFRQAGARVAFSYLRAQSEAEALAASLQNPETSGTPDCIALQHTLESAEDGESLVAKTISALGDIDILVANHGIWPPDEIPVARMTSAQWRRTQATNVESVFGLCHAAAAHMLTHPAPTPVVTNAPHPHEQTGSHTPGGPFMRDRQDAHEWGTDTASQPRTARGHIVTARGHIVLVASAAGQRGEGLHADYAASKGAIISFTKSLSSELAPHLIYANCVAPGWTHTQMTSSVFDVPEVASRINPTIPVGRPAHPYEVAGPILFLCTPLAGFISGEILNANGGAVLAG